MHIKICRLIHKPTACRKHVAQNIIYCYRVLAICIQNFYRIVSAPGITDQICCTAIMNQCRDPTWNERIQFLLRVFHTDFTKQLVKRRILCLNCCAVI